MNNGVALNLPNSDKAARALLVLSLSYLLLGLVFGTLSGFQYILPDFLKDQLSFRKTRPLHVYLVITWIFTAAQAGIYYYMPRISNRRIFWPGGLWLHFYMQLAVSVFIIVSFFAGKFGGREYLEFPPVLGLFILLSWVPFAVNFFATLKPDFKKIPAYIWFWTTGIIFFFITLSESYLWLFDFFRNNLVRDITIQWKALGSMVGSWNMLVYGTGMYVMEKISGDTRPNRSPLAFFFYFLGLTNLMFNWGHHTYIVPAEPWIRTVAYIISMTELLILGHIILQWRKTVSNARKNYHLIPYRLLTYADAWIFVNLALAIAISVPAWNYYTHGTHITVAHAMGATIGINTMILFASVFYLLQNENAESHIQERRWIGPGILITNIALLFFWISLLGSGMVKMAGKINNKSFNAIMQESKPWFNIFTYSGVIIMIGLIMMIIPAIRTSLYPKK
jgi:nitric oxide reductase subunit B